MSGQFANIFKTIIAAKYPGVISPDEMTPEMKEMQSQNQQVQAMQQQLEQAMAQTELAGKQAKAANDEARARLAEAQAYKAILDAQSRAKDVSGKNEERDFNQVMSVLDQHNSLEAEDRAFDFQRDQSTQALTNGEQDNELASE